MRRGLGEKLLVLAWIVSNAAGLSNSPRPTTSVMMRRQRNAETDADNAAERKYGHAPVNQLAH